MDWNALFFGSNKQQQQPKNDISWMSPAGQRAYQSAHNAGVSGPITYEFDPSTNNLQWSGQKQVNLGANTNVAEPVNSVPKNNNATPPQPAGPSMDQLVNDVYAPQMDYLNQAEGTIRSAYPEAQNQIEGQYNVSKQSLTDQQNKGLRDITTQEQQAGQRKEDAQSAARRLYNELMTGGMQRFGGASSAGQAFTELNANEQQRREGDIQKTYAQAMSQIGSYRQDINDKFTTALSSLEQQKNTALNQARDDFNNKLLEISRMKSEAQANKAQMRLEALQNLRNQVYSINMQQLSFAQQLAANKQASLDYVDKYAQNVMQSLTGGNQVLSSYLQSQGLNPTTSLGVSGYQQNQPNYTPTGMITTYKKPEDQLYNA